MPLLSFFNEQLYVVKVVKSNSLFGEDLIECIPLGGGSIVPSLDFGIFGHFDPENKFNNVLPQFGSLLSGRTNKLRIIALDAALFLKLSDSRIGRILLVVYEAAGNCQLSFLELPASFDQEDVLLTVDHFHDNRIRCCAWAFPSPTFRARVFFEWFLVHLVWNLEL